MPFFALTTFLSAFLLFLVQPLIARIILPWFGGTPAVWTTCMLFFQAVLLGGYAYAHGLASRLAPRTQAKVHIALLGTGLLVLGWQTLGWAAPLVPSFGWKPADSLYPIARILLILGVAVGLPYFALSTTGPLLQAWFARRHPTRSAYPLYAISNAGSLLALLAYPVAVEPTMALRAQGWMWAALFVLFAVLVSVLAWTQPPAPEPSAAAAAGPARSTAGEVALWILLPTVASVMLLATTNQLSQEVAVVPFLWVLPLAIYLLSFILCFESDRWYRRAIFVPLLVVSTPLVAAALYLEHQLGLFGQIATYSLSLFVVTMICHGELARLRPEAARLTRFYLAVSVGGVLGGLLVSLVAPAIFKSYLELHTAILATWVLAIAALLRDRTSFLWGGRISELARAGLAMGLLFSMLVLLAQPAEKSLDVRRGFYGVLRVMEYESEGVTEPALALLHGKTLHGIQKVAAERRRDPVSYFGPKTVAGLALRRERGAGLEASGPGAAPAGLRIGIIGLGIGTLAGYAEPGDYIRYYEINPDVVALAQGEQGFFSFLKESPAKVEVILGDARISMERELREREAQRYDRLVLDAFSSDAIPSHLLTREAFETYLAHLAPGGLILIHISNRYLDLEPVVWTLAKEFGLTGAMFYREEPEGFYFSSRWMLLAKDPAVLDRPEIAKAITNRKPRLEGRLWTDDYVAMLPLLTSRAIEKKAGTP